MKVQKLKLAPTAADIAPAVFYGDIAVKGGKPMPTREKGPDAPKYLLDPLGGMGFSATFANSFKKSIWQAGGNLK